MKTIGEIDTGGRDNNFNLLRMIAALLVIFSHSLALTKRNEMAFYPMTYGLIAVSMFFVMSGYLIAKSYLNNPCLGPFFLARIMRIYPASCVAVLLCVFPLGWALTPLSSLDYFSNPQTRDFLSNNLTLLFGFAESLPGVFCNNPFPYAVNGSLWTLRYELMLYILVGILGVTNILRKARLFFLFLLAYFTAYTLFRTVEKNTLSLWLHGYGLMARYTLDLSCLFLLGSAAAVFRKHIPLSWPLILLATVIALTIASLYFPLDWLFRVCFAYAVIGVALLPAGPIRRYNRLSDYSYGMYVYAFPIQQLIVHHHPKIAVLPMLVVSVGLTLLCAVASWHWIENPCLRWVKSRRKAVAPPVPEMVLS